MRPLVILLSLNLIRSLLGFQIETGGRLRNGATTTAALFERKPGGQGFGSSKQPEKSTDQGPLGDLSEERKANLFQALLRDLQIEGVPLLGVDAAQVHTLQAAVWTTLAELCDNPLEQKACLVFEYIPITALQPFVDDFMILKTQDDKMQHLPEVDRVSLSMVGKGVGPAILIEVANATSEHAALSSATLDANEEQCTTAIKAFVNRIVIDQGACPHVSSTDDAPSNLQGVAPKQIDYRVCQKADAFHVLSSFWNSLCELYASTDVGTMILTLPNVGTNPTSAVEANHARFVNIAELMSRYLCLYKGDGVYELLHFHPDYTRDWITPRDRPAHGHLPPTSWLPIMLRHNGDMEAADQLSQQDLQCSNYQRRSPVPAVCIKRVEYLEQATDDANGVIQLKLDDGSNVMASGVPTYARNTQRLAALGQETLQASIQREQNMLTN